MNSPCKECIVNSMCSDFCGPLIIFLKKRRKRVLDDCTRVILRRYLNRTNSPEWLDLLEDMEDDSRYESW